MSFGAIRIRSFPLLALLLDALVLHHIRRSTKLSRWHQRRRDGPGRRRHSRRTSCRLQKTRRVSSTSSVSSSAGEYSFPDLPLGLYTVSATSSGFETLKVEKVQVSAGTTYSLPIKLAVAVASNYG